MTAHDLPAVNACLNGLSAVFLLLGYRAIRRGNPRAHRAFMSAALTTSSTRRSSSRAFDIVRGKGQPSSTSASAASLISSVGMITPSP